MIQHEHTKKEYTIHTYLVYDRDTGKIVHRHRQSEEIDITVGEQRDRILKFVRPSFNKGNLAIVSIEGDAMKLEKRYRIHPKKKTLEEIA